MIILLLTANDDNNTNNNDDDNDHYNKSDNNVNAINDISMWCWRFKMYTFYINRWAV